MTHYVIRNFHQDAKDTLDEECTFCDIISRKSYAEIVYEDDHVMAFLDILPMSSGHTLLIPKKHYERLDVLSSEYGAHMGAVLPLLARAIMRATGATDHNVVTNSGAAAGQVVPHVHFHIVPKAESRDGQFSFIGRFELEDEEKEIVGHNIRRALIDLGAKIKM